MQRFYNPRDDSAVEERGSRLTGKARDLELDTVGEPLVLTFLEGGEATPNTGGQA